MALAIGTTVGAHSTSAVTSLTYAINCAGFNMLVVGVTASNAGGSPSAVTYAGVPMTKGVELTDNVSRNTSQWYLANPTTGSNNVIITAGGTQWLLSGATPFSGASGLIGGTGTAASTAGGTALSVSITTTGTGSIVVDSIYQNNNGLTLTPNGAQTQQWHESNTDGEAGYGSTKPVASPTSTTMTWTQSSSGAWVMTAMEVLAAAANPAHGFFMQMLQS